MRCEIADSAAQLEALGPRWQALHTRLGRGLTTSHRWLSAWWRAYAGIDALSALTVVDAGAALVAAWPLLAQTPRVGALRAAELRLLGDVGVTQQSLLVDEHADNIDELVALLARTLVERRGWDVLDVPLRGRVAERMAAAFQDAGLRARLVEATGRPYLELPPAERWDEFARTRRAARSPARPEFHVESDARRGLEELLRLCRKEWAAAEESGPAADAQTVGFLYDVTPGLCAEGLARFGVLSAGGRVAAVDLVITSDEGAVQVLRGVDPELAPSGALAELALASVETAVRAGAQHFTFATGAPVAGVEEEAPLKAVARRSQRLQAWSHTTRARLHRGVVSLSGVVRSVEELPQTLDRLRGRAPGFMQRAVARVASYTTLHLYRGELFMRDVATPHLQLTLLTREAFEALPLGESDELTARLELQLPYCMKKWARGDLVVLARVAERPAGILWCARNAVFVPDIGREVRPQPGECYIHDVFVHPAERGRQVAPAMLEFLARELRARDVYRGWALIERTNTASIRAFEKAAYASVADVSFARVGMSTRIRVRPPDEEARALLGL